MTVTADLVAGILPVRPDGRLLLLQRAATGTWEPPAGRLTPGESFETGAVRELYEETGLLVSPMAILATWVGLRPGGEQAKLASVIFLGRTTESEVRLSDEHLDYRWATMEEWLKLPSWWSPENIERVDAPLSSLPKDPYPPPSLPKPDMGGVVRANLGAGTVVADLEGDAPRALLLRRRKPPTGLWENPGGMLEPGEDFLACARRETLEETGLEAEPETAWWARVEPWRDPEDPESYAGVGFLARHPGGDVRLEDKAHDTFRWVTEPEWRALPTWYAEEESDILWNATRELRR